jgi:hypothetical protein
VFEYCILTSKYKGLGSPVARVGGQHQSKLSWKMTNNANPLLLQNKKNKDQLKAQKRCKSLSPSKSHPRKRARKVQRVNSDEDDADNESEMGESREESDSEDELDKYKNMKSEIQAEFKVFFI